MPSFGIVIAQILNGLLGYGVVSMFYVQNCLQCNKQMYWHIMNPRHYNEILDNINLF